jgi:hypothetical protein
VKRCNNCAHRMTTLSAYGIRQERVTGLMSLCMRTMAILQMCTDYHLQNLGVWERLGKW